MRGTETEKEGRQQHLERVHGEKEEDV